VRHVGQNVGVGMVSVETHLVVPEHVLEGEDLATAVVLELAGHGSVLAASLVFSSEGDGDGLGTAKLSVFARQRYKTNESL